MQNLRLIDRKPRLDLRALLLFALLLLAGLMVAQVVGRISTVEQQVLGIVILNIMVLTAIVSFYDLTFAFILWFYALTYLLRYTQLSLPGVPDMSGPRFMLVVVWGVFFVQVVLRRRRPLALGRIEWMMAIFLAGNMIDMIHHQNVLHTAQRESPITSFMNFAVFPATVFYIVRNACTSDRAVRRFLIAFAILQTHLAVAGIFEHFRIPGLVLPPDVLDPEAGGGRWYGVRIRGPYLSSPIYGAMMGLGFYLSLHLFTHSRGKARWWLLPGFLATPLSCLYTLTRQVWIGFALPMLVGAFTSRRQRGMLALLVLVGLIFTVMADWDAVADMEALKYRASDESTGESRLAVTLISLRMFMDRPLFGHGLQSYVTVSEEYRIRMPAFRLLFWNVDMSQASGITSHNAFLRMAVELGLAGMVPFVLMHVFIFQKSWSLYRRLPARGLFGRDLVVTFWQLSIPYLVLLTLTDPSFSEFMPGVFFTWSAIIVRRAELAEAEAAGLPVPPGHTLAAAAE